MRCPVDGTTLALTDRNGVEIDYCPQCRGVWLDHGELDRIIDRSGNGARFDDSRHRYENNDRHDHHHDRDHDDRHGWQQRPGRRRAGPLGALGDLFGGGD